MKKVNVLLSDSQELTRIGLSNLIKSEKGLKLVASNNNWSELINEASEKQPDIIICDYNSDNTYPEDFIDRLNTAAPLSSIIIVTNDSDERKIHSLIGSGARGFLTKSCSSKEILNSITTVHEGNRFFCPTVLDILVNKPDLSEEKEASIENLSQRENEVLRFIAEGFSTQQISEKLHLSIHTINSHRKNIYKKLKLKKPHDLILFAVDNGLVPNSN